MSAVELTGAKGRAIKSVGPQGETTPSGLRMQMLSRDLPVAGTGGSSVYRLGFLEYLSRQGWTIEFDLFRHRRSPEGERYATNRSLQGIAQVVPHHQKMSPPVWNDLPTDRERRFFQGRLVAFQPDVVVADRVWLGGLLDTVDAGVPTALLTHDVVHQRYRDFAAAGLEPFKKSAGLQHPVWDRELEAQQLRRANIILAIQDTDAKTFTDMAPDARVITMPMGMEIPLQDNEQQVPTRVLFVGGSASHNVDGMKWFLNHVWPHVVDAVPQAELHVIGNIRDSFDPSTHPQTVFTGPISVAELDKEYEQTAVCIVPARVGSGLKTKLVEALGSSRACVSTSVGVQGIEDAVGQGVLLADSAELFAARVRTLLQSPLLRRVTEAQARDYAVKNLSSEATYGTFVTTVYQCLQGARNNG